MADPLSDVWSDEEEQNEKPKDRVILRNIPPGFTIDGLRNMCSVYGNVKELSWPNEKTFAFVTYSSNAEALYMLQHFKQENPNLSIIVEFAIERDNRPQALSRDEEDFLVALNAPTLKNSDELFRNVLEMDTRRIKGPFSSPVELYKCESLVEPLDYRRNLILRMTDKNKEFLWDSNDERTIAYERGKKKIVHGRAFLKLLLDTNNNDLSNCVNKEKNSFKFNAELLPSVSECINCNRPADMKCKDCTKTVCSLECHSSQQNGAPIENHKNVSDRRILPMTTAREIEKYVKITAVINHRSVFVRPAGVRNDIDFARLLCDTAKYEKTAEMLTVEPAIGSFVLAKFGFYQRALVLKQINKTTMFVVAFIDFGNVETIDYRDMKVMPEKLKAINRFATKISLIKIEHDLMNTDALQTLYEYLITDAELEIEIVSKGDLHHATKAKLRADKWINEMVHLHNIDGIEEPKNKGLASDCQISNKEVICDEMLNKEIIILNNLKIKYQGELTFIVADDLNEFRANDQRIQTVCNYLFTQHKCYTPRCNEYCMVRFQNRWYRGVCVEIAYDGFATVDFIDYGNLQLIEVVDVRPIPECLRFPLLTIIAVCFPDMIDTKPAINLQQQNFEDKKVRQKALDDLKAQEKQLDDKEQELKQKYSELSRCKVLKMEYHINESEDRESTHILYATLQ